eukprot:scaffold1686_cov371-Prasinococcus_capsulatus_cf.AAC.3
MPHPRRIRPGGRLRAPSLASGVHRLIAPAADQTLTLGPCYGFHTRSDIPCYRASLQMRDGPGFRKFLCVVTRRGMLQFRSRRPLAPAAMNAHLLATAASLPSLHCWRSTTVSVVRAPLLLTTLAERPAT